MFDTPDDEAKAKSKEELDDAVAKLAEETELLDGGDSNETAARVIKQHAPIVAIELVRLSQQASSETVRLNAGKYIIDRVLGPVGKDDGPVENPLDEFVKAIEAAANKGSV